MRLRRKKKDEDADAPVAETPTDSTKKGVSLPKIAVIILVVLIVLAGAGFAVKKFVLKPKAATTISTAATTKTASATTPTSTSGSAAPKPAPSSSDDPEMSPCQMVVLRLQGSDTFIGSKAGTEVTVKIMGAYMPGYGALVAEMERQASAIVRGTVQVQPVSVEHGINRMTAKVILADGRDAAAVLAESGWATAADDAGEAVKKLAQVATDSKRGMYAEEFRHPPWTNY